MAAWRGCCPSLGRCLWSSKISQPPDPALQTSGASQGCKRWAAAGVGSKRACFWQSDCRGRAWLTSSAPPFCPASQMEATSFWACLGGTMPVRKAGDPQCQACGIWQQRGQDKFIPQRSISSLSFLLLTHHHHHCCVLRLGCGSPLLHPDFWVKISK